MSRILVAMSGGVDSSLAAALLVEAGHEVVGATLRTFCYSSGPAHAKSCCGLEGVQDARSIARTLGIPHTVFDVEDDFTRDVIDDFVAEYAEGRTPNPCVRCNTFTKFRDLLRRARELGADRIATGHYARIRHGNGRPHALLRGADPAKDQAYFLWGLSRDALASLAFPLGELTKAEVRDLARDKGLLTADKPESQEICFVPTGDYRDLLRIRLEPDHPALAPGDFVTISGQRVGEHDGYAMFTVGQRKGLPGGFAEPMFVVEIRPDTREVVLGTREELQVSGLELEDVNWLAAPPSDGHIVQAQLRHRSRPSAARVQADAGGPVTVRLLNPQAAVTPGQSCVLFLDDLVLGGGRIKRGLRSADRLST